jgi:glucose-6-phosphate 1-dehydrogenase
VIAIGAMAKAPGEEMTGRPVELHLANDSPDEMTAYERLLGDALDGETFLFAREDGVESAWRVVDTVLRDHGPAFPYEPGTWGPVEADEMVDDPHGWHHPGP